MNSTITFIEDEKALTKKKQTETGDASNKYFSNIIGEPNFEIDEIMLCDTAEETGPVLRAIQKYLKYPCILEFKIHFMIIFSFQMFSLFNLESETNRFR